MANFRQIHTQIWKDEWFLDLEPDEKLFFIYLFSNESTSISGLYKLAFKVMCFESGLEQKRAREILGKFAAQGKVYYSDGLVWIVNMRKYHASQSIKIKTRIEKDLELIPDCDLKIQYLYHMDTLSNDVGQKGKRKEDENENEDEEKDENNIFRILLDGFYTFAKLPIDSNLRQRDIDAVNQWVDAECTKEDVEAAVQYSSENGFTIVSPASVSKGVMIARSNRLREKKTNNTPAVRV